jgi:hypothetical protein
MGIIRDRVLWVNFNCSTNKKTKVVCGLNYSNYFINFSNLSYDYHEHDEEIKKYKTVSIEISEHDKEFIEMKTWKKGTDKPRAYFSFMEIDNNYLINISAVLKRDAIVRYISSIENNGREYVDNLYFSISVDSEYYNNIDFKKESTTQYIPAKSFNIAFRMDGKE